MDLKIEELENNGYHLIEELQHDELIPFVQRIFRSPNWITKTYIWLNIILIIGLLALIVVAILDGKSFGSIIGQVSWGILLLLPIIPIHEGLHGAVYKYLGAPKVHYTANFKRFYFTAQADRFLVDKNGFYPLAFTPFLVINSAAIVLMFIFPEYLLLLCTFLFSHTTACGGDFALAAYFYNKRDTGLITYDDVPNKRTFFYARVKSDELKVMSDE